MMIDRLRKLRPLWEMISDVPGWPDAPLGRRIRRAAPVVLPFLSAVVVTATHWGFFEPRRDAVRAQHEELLWLEQENAQFTAAISEAEATDLFARAEAAKASVLASPDEATDWLRSLAPAMRELGWRASFHAYDSSLEPAEEGAPLGFVPALGKLEPLQGNTNHVASLVHSLEKITQSGKRIDLTRMTIRADVPGRPQVEVNLRLPYLLADAKTTE